MLILYHQLFIPLLLGYPEDTEKVLIIGMGIVGLLMVAFLRYAGCRADITVMARYPFQGELAKKVWRRQGNLFFLTKFDRGNSGNNQSFHTKANNG